MKVLLLNQAFYPDVVSTAQHLTDLAAHLSKTGHQVTVVSSRRAYDSPDTRFLNREHWEGVDIVRIPCTGFGKGAKWRRVADFASYMLACCGYLATLPRFDIAVSLTSPPLLPFVAALFSGWTRTPLVLWLMDLNPDEAIAAGWLNERSLSTRTMQAAMKFSFRAASLIVVLDRFMEERVVSKGISASKLAVLPPWSHTDSIGYDHEGRKEFRKRHGLIDTFVIMYSGNHSPCHPLDTVLEAAGRLRNESKFLFCFVGGGSELKKVRAFAEDRRLKNILILPYQPLNTLSASLSAADLHLVVMGDPLVGMVHPCKIYNILSLQIPLLYIGPRISHVTDIPPHNAFGKWVYVAEHGQIDQVVTHIRKCAEGKSDMADAIALSQRFSQSQMVPTMARLVTSVGPQEQVSNRESRTAADA